jgi:hypothetical protein
MTYRTIEINDEVTFTLRKHRHTDKPYSVMITVRPKNGERQDLYNSESTGKLFESEAMAITWGLYKILDPGELVTLLITLKNENLQPASGN